MSLPKISVIIPAFNAAPYLQQCIESVQKQTYTNVEVIVVNDGSTDNSVEILDSISEIDSRIKVFHSENKGVSTARNFGLQKATGDFISFCDADDFMEPTMLDELYNAMKQHDCDWVVSNVTMIFNDGSKKIRLHLYDEVFDIASNRPLFIEGLMRFYYDNANWNKLFKASIIQHNRLYFEEDMNIWEDLLFNLQYAQFAAKVFLLKKPLYNYRVLENSLFSGNKGVQIPMFNKLYLHFTKFTENQKANLEKVSFKKQMARIAYFQLLHQCEMQVRKETGNPVQVCKMIYRQLTTFVPGSLQFAAEQKTGIQGIKMKLLHNRQFLLFAIGIALKPFLRKPLRLFKSIIYSKS